MHHLQFTTPMLTADRRQKRCPSSHKVQTPSRTEPTGRPAFLTHRFESAVFLGSKYKNEKTVSAAFYRAAENLIGYLDIQDFTPSNAPYPANLLTDFHSLNAIVENEMYGELSLVDLKGGEVSLQLIENLNVNQMLLYFVPVEPLFMLLENNEQTAYKLLLEIFRFVHKQGVADIMSNGYYQMMLQDEDERDSEFFEEYDYSFDTLNSIFDRNIIFQQLLSKPFNIKKLKKYVKDMSRAQHSDPLLQIADEIFQLLNSFKNRAFNQMYNLLHFEEFEPLILPEEYLTFVWNSSEKCNVYTTYEEFLTAHCNECSQQIFPNSCLSLNLSPNELAEIRNADTVFVTSFLKILDNLISYLKRYEP